MGMRDNIRREYTEKQVYSAPAEFKQECKANVTGKASLNTVQGNALIAFLSDGLLMAPGLRIDEAGPNIKKFEIEDAFAFRINKVAYIKTAAGELTFGTAWTVNDDNAEANIYGAFLFQINASGTVSVKAAKQDQDYTTRAAAVAALPAPDTNNIAIGYVVVRTKDEQTWTADTSDLGDDTTELISTEFVDGDVAALPALIS